MRPLLARTLVAATAVALLSGSVAVTAYAATSPVAGATASVAPSRVSHLAANRDYPSGWACRGARAGSVNLVCVIGRSVDGRPIVAERQGNPGARRVLVVSGQKHGEEWPGPRSVDVIRHLPTPRTASYVIWTVRTMNPDGGAIGRRRNSHGVDLNGNFPAKFKRMADTGPRPLSEPESRAMATFLTWVQPDLVISLHGFSTAVDTTGGGRRAELARQFSALSRITPAHNVPCNGPCHGNMTDWYTATSTVGGVAFTVEMPRSSLVVRTCGVPGHRRGTPIQCVAWAASSMAARLPR
ncbi:MAG: hypothetical protein GC157_10170 [Frankiales bacterium]|nr:hypothetical protein [Frankiales bacterium]